eukprot:TRINITY_DN1637_c0_g1_i5.p1 TRINITY_DN1637_c0_g1~~TRINITY_DN1637_c0_g1_i5.p1  ORF type:complete len:620 (+),score=219.59 TRINITY_DN1637_c0_g1_i5:85-1944(+)
MIPAFILSSESAGTTMEPEAAHEFFGLNAFLFVVIVSCCLLIDYNIKKYKFFYLPESAAVMLFGMVIGFMIAWVGTKEQEEAMKFDPSLFFFILLPPIVFEAGYTLQQGKFFSNFGTILLYAVPGTLFSTFIVGYGLYGLAKADIVPLNKENALECLMFGSLISATDPVATLTLMGSPVIAAPPVLYNLVFGEAVLNDAVAIVLYKTFESFLEVPFTSSTIAQAFVKFIWVSIGSLLVGLGVALACALLFKKTDFSSLPHFEITLILLFAFGSYFLAEVIHLSGIMALFFCGIGLAHYNFYNISESSKIATHDAFKSLAQVCDTFVFAYLGITIGLASGGETHYDWSFSLAGWTLFLCLIARIFNTFPLTFLANLKRRKKIPLPMQINIWFAGLRGAIAFALSLQVPTPNGSKIMTSTLLVVIFTTYVCGGLTEPLLRAMGMKGVAGAPKAKRRASLASLERKKKRLTEIERFWFSFDNMYMKYWFGGKIQEEFSVYREPLSAEALAAQAGGHDEEESTDEDEPSGPSAPSGPSIPFPVHSSGHAHGYHEQVDEAEPEQKYEGEPEYTEEPQYEGEYAYDEQPAEEQPVYEEEPVADESQVAAFDFAAVQPEVPAQRRH